MQQVCDIQKPRNYQDDLLIALRFKQTQFCTKATQARRTCLDSLEFGVRGKKLKSAKDTDASATRH